MSKRKAKVYDSSMAECLFTETHTPPDAIKWDGVSGRMRTKTVDAGPKKYIKLYPLWDTGEIAKKAREQVKKSRPAQIALNDRNSQERMMWKTNANFGIHDILCSPAFDDSEQPKDDREALKIIRWYIDKIKAIRKRDTLGEMKYIYVIEKTESEEKGTRYHYHMVMNGLGINREEIEALWTKRFTKSFCNTRRYQKNDDHMGGWARYMGMDKPKRKGKPEQKKATTRRWNCSKNLKPFTKVRTSDHKISRAKAQKITRNFEREAKRILEKAYPGYILKLDSVKVKTSPYVQGVYIYAEMHRRD